MDRNRSGTSNRGGRGGRDNDRRSSRPAPRRDEDRHGNRDIEDHRERKAQSRRDDERRDIRRETRREASRDEDDRRGSRRTSSSKASPRREYWKPSAESARKQMTRSRSRFDSPFRGEMFRPKQGDNCTRILPPTWADPEHYCLSVWEHRYIGPDESHYLCLRKMKNEPCKICDAERDARDHGDADDAKKLKPMQRWVCYTMHRDAEDKALRKKPLIWDMNSFQDEEIVGRTYDKKTDAALDVSSLDNGYDLSFRRTGQADRTRYVNFEFDRDPSPAMDDPDDIEEIWNYISENPITECLNYFDNEYLEKMLFGTAEARDEDLDDTTNNGDSPEDDDYGKDAPENGDDVPPEDEPEENGEDNNDDAPPEDDDAPPEDDDAPPEDAEQEPEPEVRPAPRRPLAAKNNKAEREERRPSRSGPRPAPRQQPRRPAPRRYQD